MLAPPSGRAGLESLVPRRGEWREVKPSTKMDSGREDPGGGSCLRTDEGTREPGLEQKEESEKLAEEAQEWA